MTQVSTPPPDFNTDHWYNNPIFTVFLKYLLSFNIPRQLSKKCESNFLCPHSPSICSYINASFLFKQKVMTGEKCIMLAINFKYHSHPLNTMKNRSLQRSNFRQDPLPFSQEPSINFPSFYYKTMDRVEEHHCVIRVGLKLHQMRRF